MRIAICDDEKPYREKIVDLIREYNCTRQDLSLTLFSFSSANELLNFTYEHGGFDLYILDIVMPKTSGIQLGSALRVSGDDGMIIYLTTSPDFALESYAVEAFHYLLKPIDTAAFFHCLTKAADRFDHFKQAVIPVKTSSFLRMVPVRSICFAERMGRLVCYHLSDGSFLNSVTFNGSFQNAVAPLLEHKEIILVGSSFAVNLQHVTEITRRDLVISGKQKIAIPRGKYETYKTKWSDFWLNGGECHAI